MIFLYKDAFTSGDYDQYIDMRKHRFYLMDLIKQGRGFFMLDKDRLVGFALGYGLINDSLLPDKIRKDYNLDECYYLAQFAVRSDYRCQGIGSKLLNRFVKSVSRKYIFLRTIADNKKSLDIYKRAGFKPSVKLSDTLLSKDKKG